MLGRKPTPQMNAPSASNQAGGYPVQILTANFVIGAWLPPMDAPLIGFLNQPAAASLVLYRCKLSALDPQVTVSGDVPEIMYGA
jgi:hypothetical protein